MEEDLIVQPINIPNADKFKLETTSEMQRFWLSCIEILMKEILNKYLVNQLNCSHIDEQLRKSEYDIVSQRLMTCDGLIKTHTFVIYIELFNVLEDTSKEDHEIYCKNYLIMNNYLDKLYKSLSCDCKKPKFIDRDFHNKIQKLIDKNSNKYGYMRKHVTSSNKRMNHQNNRENKDINYIIMKVPENHRKPLGTKTTNVDLSLQHSISDTNKMDNKKSISRRNKTISNKIIIPSDTKIHKPLDQSTWRPDIKSSEINRRMCQSYVNHIIDCKSCYDHYVKYNHKKSRKKNKPKNNKINKTDPKINKSVNNETVNIEYMYNVIPVNHYVPNFNWTVNNDNQPNWFHNQLSNIIMPDIDNYNIINNSSHRQSVPGSSIDSHESLQSDFANCYILRSIAENFQSKFIDYIFPFQSQFQDIRNFIDNDDNTKFFIKDHPQVVSE